MKPFCIVSIATILGIVTGLYLNSIAFLFVLCINIFAILKFKGFLKKYMCVALIGFVAFYIYIISLESKYEKIVNNYENKTIMVQGIIVSSGEQKEYKTQYELQVRKVYSESTNEVKTENFNVICNIKGQKQEINLNYGDEIIFETVFEAPDIQRNEGGFNYSMYLKTQKIAGKVTAECESIKQIAIKNGSTILRLINNLRNFFIEKIYGYLPEEQASLCAALILGDKSGLSAELEDNFREASLSHMLAISGAHISYILLGITIVLENLKIHKRWSKVFVCVFLLFFMILAGGSPSITRACIMVILKLMAQILFLKSSTYNNLGISAFLILLFNPYAILDIGLQLSFVGTIGIVTFVDVFYDIRLKKKGIIRKQDRIDKTEKIQRKKYSTIAYKLLIYVEQTVIMALAANMVIIPIMLYNFSTIYLNFIISNLLATPIMGVCLIMSMIFLLSFIIPPFAYGVSFILTPLLKIFINVAKLSSKIPFANFFVPTPKIWQIIIYYLIIIIIFFKDKIKQCYKKYNLPVLKKNKYYIQKSHSNFIYCNGFAVHIFTNTTKQIRNKFCRCRAGRLYAYYNSVK